jgi:hypothetical protein
MPFADYLLDSLGLKLLYNIWHLLVPIKTARWPAFVYITVIGCLLCIPAQTTVPDCRWDHNVLLRQKLLEIILGAAFSTTVLRL